MIEVNKLSSKVSICRTPLSFSIVVEPQRSLWAMIVTPAAFFYTEFRLMIAAQRLPYMRTFARLGLVLDVVYMWWFCWNAFGRQVLVFGEGDMTITKEIFWDRLFSAGEDRRDYCDPISRGRLSYAGFYRVSCER